jgi:hypothetical protein
VHLAYRVLEPHMENHEVHVYVNNTSVGYTLQKRLAKTDSNGGGVAGYRPFLSARGTCAPPSRAYDHHIAPQMRRHADTPLTAFNCAKGV